MQRACIISFFWCRVLRIACLCVHTHTHFTLKCLGIAPSICTFFFHSRLHVLRISLVQNVSDPLNFPDDIQMSVRKSVASRNNREIIVHEYHPYVRNATYLQTLHGNMSVGGMKSGGGNLSCNCTDEGLIWGGCECVPEWWLICYYAVIGAAFFCNVFVCGMLLKRKKDGTYLVTYANTILLCHNFWICLRCWWSTITVKKRCI